LEQRKGYRGSENVECEKKKGDGPPIKGLAPGKKERVEHRKSWLSKKLRGGN